MKMTGAARGNPSGLNVFREAKDSAFELDCRRMKIGNKQLALFVQDLFQYSTLRRILLDGNAIGDSGISSLVDALRIYVEINYVSLDGNNFGDKGLVSLWELKVDRPELVIEGVDLSVARIVEAQERLRTQAFEQDQRFWQQLRKERYRNRSMDGADR